MPKYTIDELTKRYEISRPALYKRIKATKIQIKKDGNKSYLLAEDIEILDDLAQYLQKGGNMSTFVPTTSTTIHQDESVKSSLNTVNSLVITDETINQSLNSVKPVIIKVHNPIEHWEKLEKAVNSKYYLSTKEVRELLGTSPRGSEWIRGSFKFIKVGKIGNQSAWKVERL